MRQDRMSPFARRRRTVPGLAALLAAFFAAAGVTSAQERLGSYEIDADKVSISGISSGAFMANQFHIAHSQLVMGAGNVAGGLYACAVNKVTDEGLDALATRALGACMSVPAGLKPVETYKSRIETLAGKGWIDPIDGLQGDRVYLFTGRADTVVNPATVARAAEVYRALGVEEQDLAFRDRPLPGEGAGHSWVTEDYGVPCEANADPFINKCGYDQAKDILSHTYGELRPRADSLSGVFVAFSQAEFAPDGKLAHHGLHDTGFLYVPQTCAEGTRCALHVVLHGCKQSAEVLGDVFYKNVGVNEWADTNDIIVLYPQASAVVSKDFQPPRATDLFEVNPEGCWNWWGYAYDERFALKDGVQIQAIYGMIQRLMGRDGT